MTLARVGTTAAVDPRRIINIRLAQDEEGRPCARVLFDRGEAETFSNPDEVDALGRFVAQLPELVAGAARGGEGRPLTLPDKGQPAKREHGS